MKKLFIAGPMRGLNEYNYPAFFEAALSLQAQGYDTFNPARADDLAGFPWRRVPAIDATELPEGAFERCEKAVIRCDAIVVLPGWHDSEGVRREISLADSLGKPVLSYPSMVPISNVERELAGLESPEIEPEADEPRRLKLMIVGHARHGKDTVAELIATKTGLELCDSSRFACEAIVRPHLELAHGITYATGAECYDDRINHRPKWFEAISNYNADDPSRLARELYREADIYVGIRSRVEFFATRDVIDLAIWVDGSKRNPDEPRTSFDIRRSDCDLIIDNNGTLDQLERRIDRLVEAFGLLDQFTRNAGDAFVEAACPSAFLAS